MAGAGRARADGTPAQRVVAQFVAEVDRESLAVHGVHVAIGSDEAEHRWSADERRNIHSVSKGVCVLAVGIAVDEGLLAPESTVGGLLPELAPSVGAASVTLRHLLSMTSGIDFAWFAGDVVPDGDLARAFLRSPGRNAGTVFQYSDASTYVAMRMLAVVVGDAELWVRTRVLGPLGIDEPHWEHCPRGYVLGGSGLHLRTAELARIGRVLRDRGRWAGEQLVPEAWVEGMHSDWVSSGGGAPFERYGLGTWSGPGGCWRLDGHLGQYVVVAPENDAVVTITAHEEERDHRLAELAAEAVR